MSETKTLDRVFLEAMGEIKDLKNELHRVRAENFRLRKQIKTQGNPNEDITS
jgi:hypothetical protein